MFKPTLIFLFAVGQLCALNVGPVESEIKVYIFNGQSNMQGRHADGTSVSDRGQDQRIQTVDYFFGASSSPLTFAAMYSPFGNVDTQYRFGPEVGFARAMAKTQSVAVIKYAIGGSSIANWIEPGDVVAPDNDGIANQWSAFQTFIDQALVKLRAGGRTVTVAGFIYAQGAEDSNADAAVQPALSNAYATHLASLIASHRTITDGGLPNLPFIILRSPNWDSKTFEEVIRSAQVTVANADAYAVWVDSDAPGSVTATWEDASHIDAATQDRLGVDAAGAYLANF